MLNTAKTDTENTYIYMLCKKLILTYFISVLNLI